MKKTSNNKKILTIIVIILVFFLIFITYNKLKFEKSDKKPSIYYINVSDDKKEIINTKSDKEMYKDSIISDIVTTCNYKLLYNDYISNGKVYIGNDGYLYILDDTKNLNKRISDVKIKTIYDNKNISSYDSVQLYLISSESQLYYLSFIDPTKITLYLIPTKYKVTNFTTLEYKGDNIHNLESVRVLEEDTNIYDSYSEIRYTDSITALDSYFIYDDNTISNIYGNMMKDKNNKTLQIKYYVSLKERIKQFNDSDAIIITNDNRIIWQDEQINSIQIYSEKIAKIDYSKLNNDELKINIEFENREKITINAFNNDYYGFS